MADMIDARSIRNVHFLVVVLKDLAAVHILILKDYTAILDNSSLVTPFAVISEFDIAPFALPLIVDVVELIDFGLLALRKRHILLELLDGLCIF
jgi:hypothetical protein